MKGRVAYIIVIFVLFLLIFGRQSSQMARSGKIFYLQKSKNVQIEIYRGKIDSIIIKNDTILSLQLPGGYGGASYLLGCKYSEFDPITLKRVFVVQKKDTIGAYRFDELDSLPFVMIDTFKVHILP